MGVSGLWDELVDCEHKVPLNNLSSFIKGRSAYSGLRIAIDVPIWLFHVRDVQGGLNPHLRTFFFRLCKIISLGLKPVFVFDGPDKPAFKRGAKSYAYTDVDQLLYEELINAFGFPVWHAAGEAEAECAALETAGYVDAVMTDDVDALLFGSKNLIRNWTQTHDKQTRTKKKTSHVPNHISVYSMNELYVNGLDKDGLILIALMNGGDYLPAGVEKCGRKTAMQLAKAGWGKELVQALDSGDLDDWRERLREELKCNPRKTLTSKHPAIKIPDTFPDLTILRFYTHPKVHAGTKPSIFEWTPPNLDVLVRLAQEHFGWGSLTMQTKLRNIIIPSILLAKMRDLASSGTNSSVQIPKVNEASTGKKKSTNPQLTQFFPVRKSGGLQPKTFYQRNELSTLPITNITRSRINGDCDDVSELRVEFNISSLMAGVSKSMTKSISSDPVIINSDDDDDRIFLSSSQKSSNGDVDEGTYFTTDVIRLWVQRDMIEKLVPDLARKFKTQEAQAAKARQLKVSKAARRKEDNTKGQELMASWLSKSTKADSAVDIAKTSPTNNPIKENPIHIDLTSDDHEDLQDVLEKRLPSKKGKKELVSLPNTSPSKKSHHS